MPYNILEDIAKELNLKEEELEDEKELEEDESDEEELEEEDDSEVLEEDDDIEQEENEEEDDESLKNLEFKPQAPSKEEKEKFAFEKLRREAKERAAELEQFEELAHSYGFSSYKEMYAKMQQEAMEREAKKQGIDPRIYKELQETKKSLEELKKERQMEVQQTKIQTVVTRVDAFCKQNNLSETDKVELLNSLDEDGFTVDNLFKIKNYDKLFTGYVKEKVLAAEKQKEIEKEAKRNRLQEKKFQTGGNQETFDMDKAIEALMKSRR